MATSVASMVLMGALLSTTALQKSANDHGAGYENQSQASLVLDHILHNASLAMGSDMNKDSDKGILVGSAETGDADTVCIHQDVDDKGVMHLDSAQDTKDDHWLCYSLKTSGTTRGIYYCYKSYDSSVSCPTCRGASACSVTDKFLGTASSWIPRFEPNGRQLLFTMSITSRLKSTSDVKSNDGSNPETTVSGGVSPAMHSIPVIIPCVPTITCEGRCGQINNGCQVVDCPGCLSSQKCVGTSCVPKATWNNDWSACPVCGTNVKQYRTCSSGDINDCIADQGGAEWQYCSIPACSWSACTYGSCIAATGMCAGNQTGSSTCNGPNSCDPAAKPACSSQSCTAACPSGQTCISTTGQCCTSITCPVGVCDSAYPDNKCGGTIDCSQNCSASQSCNVTTKKCDPNRPPPCSVTSNDCNGKTCGYGKDNCGNQVVCGGQAICCTPTCSSCGVKDGCGGTCPACCPATGPCNGVCGTNTIPNSCQSGTFVAGTSTTTQITWTCNGSPAVKGCTVAKTCKPIVQPVKAGKTVTCSQTISSGACSAPLKLNTCAANNTVTDIPDTATNYQWKCAGTNGTVVTCSLPKPIDGVCSTDTNNVCISGTSKDVADTPTLYKWSCVGSNGGSTDTCSLSKPINGACSTKLNTCVSATVGAINPVYHQLSSGSYFTWDCPGSNGGTTALNCQWKNVISNLNRGLCSTLNKCYPPGSVGQTFAFDPSSGGHGRVYYNDWSCSASGFKTEHCAMAQYKKPDGSWSTAYCQNFITCPANPSNPPSQDICQIYGSWCYNGTSSSPFQLTDCWGPCL
ncbi:MAG: hypothetical protein HQL15_07930 [Candidatus Omnitrophica bacterium]|nr:hypothetical protein [Candidatus Omnitrophota bacterium]